MAGPPRGIIQRDRKERREIMPLIEIHMLEGRSDEQKKVLLNAVTKAVQDSIGVPVEAIRVWIQEMPPTEYMAAGVLAADRKK